MKTLIAITTALAVLAPSLANAGKYTNAYVNKSAGKRTTCTSETYITGTTKTTCRTAH